MKLLTEGQHKLDKSTEYGYLSAGITLAPATEYADTTGEKAPTLCASAGACAALCLAGTGRYGTNPAQQARINRTRFLLEDREGFLDQAEREIRNFAKRAARLGYAAAIRPNLLSDLTWLGVALAERMPEVQFYDYTKHRAMMDKERLAKLPENYNLTYSISEKDIVDGMIGRGRVEGMNCAVVFDTPKGMIFPKEIEILGQPIRITDGDKHDLRFLDGRPCIVGLRFKGSAVKKQEAVDQGFVVETQPGWYGAR
jgi:hypothetical protein